MFRTRLISGIALILIALAVIIAGGPVLLLTLLAVSLIGMFELYRALQVDKKIFGPLALSGYGGAVIYYLLIGAGKTRFSLAVLLLLLALMMSVYVFTWPAYQSRQVMEGYFGLIYVAVMLSHIYLTRRMNDGAWLVWLIFLCSWGCDTCAYCVGMLIGKHKMSPKLSPKKSVEGAVGGVLGAAALGAIYAAAAGPHMALGRAPVWEYALICAVGALISMVGDLAASAIKRGAGIKDYGKLIPGHGGILDRFDSVIFTAPVIWLLAQAVL